LSGDAWQDRTRAKSVRRLELHLTLFPQGNPRAKGSFAQPRNFFGSFAPRFPEKEDENKGDHIVKNRNIHFKAAAGLMIPMLLACFAAVFISAPIPAIAANQVPFNASFTTEFTTVFVPPFYLRVFVTGEGNASQMGRTSAVTTDQLINLEDGSGTATYSLTAANGDTVVVAISARNSSIPGGIMFEGDYTVTGGTGRFVGATGSGFIAGTALNTGPNTGVGSFTLVGTISSPGQGH
jgi:hypothetical protein